MLGGQQRQRYTVPELQVFERLGRAAGIQATGAEPARGPEVDSTRADLAPGLPSWLVQALIKVVGLPPPGALDQGSDRNPLMTCSVYASGRSRRGDAMGPERLFCSWTSARAEATRATVRLSS